MYSLTWFKKPDGKLFSGPPLVKLIRIGIRKKLVPRTREEVQQVIDCEAMRHKSFIFGCTPSKPTKADLALHQWLYSYTTCDESRLYDHLKGESNESCKSNYI